MNQTAPDEFGDWPTMLARIARIIGREAALHLASIAGGLDHVRIPHRVTTTHMWAKILEHEAWVAIVKEFGGEYIDLPRGTYVTLRKAEIIRMAEAGETNHRQIALRVHVTERYVRRILSDIGMSRSVAIDPRQTKLFE